VVTGGKEQHAFSTSAIVCLCVGLVDGIYDLTLMKLEGCSVFKVAGDDLVFEDFNVHWSRNICHRRNPDIFIASCSDEAWRGRVKR
jgi:hypothetical protein